jgi:LDH2 family malate/lactate/ureidoglycolate dehydrogenase
MENKHESENWGSLVIAINPDVFGSDTVERFQESAMTMCNRVKNAKRLPSNEDQELYLPGERGDLLEKKHLESGHITMSSVLYDELVRQVNS